MRNTRTNEVRDYVDSLNGQEMGKLLLLVQFRKDPDKAVRRLRKGGCTRGQVKEAVRQVRELAERIGIRLKPTKAECKRIDGDPQIYVKRFWELSRALSVSRTILNPN